MILLSVGPGPGALCVPQIAHELDAAGYRVEVTLEPGAEYFVGPAAFIASAPVVEEVSARPEAVVFASASTGTVARLARGRCVTVAEELYASGVRPAVVAPEMDDGTREHPAVRENVEILRKDGCRVLEGTGGMVSSLTIANDVLNARGGNLSGMRVLITAGGTREPIDRVRVVSNRSSGKMGRALAREAYRRGAEVTVVAAAVEEEEPGVRWVEVETYEQMEEATASLCKKADVLIMAAAVSDFTPESVEEGKIRRGGQEVLELRLVATGDILKTVREANPDLFMVGFAATFGDPRPDAREKLRTKGVDLMVGNDISLEGSGFSSDENEVVIVGGAEKGEAGFGELFVPRASKKEVASAILDALVQEKLGKAKRQEA